MPKRPLRLIYIDDEPTNTMTLGIKERLEDSAELECLLRQPSQDIALNVGDVPDALLVDFDLSTQNAEDKYVSYYGSTLAAEMRMRQPSCPIILISKRERISGRKQLLTDSIDVDLGSVKE